MAFDINAIWTALGTMGIIGVVLLALAFFKAYPSKKLKNIGIIAGIALVVIPLISSGIIPLSAGGTVEKPLTIVQDFTGDTSTLTHSSYDLAGDTKVQVYPALFVYDSGGRLLTDGIGANTTSTVVGEVIDIYANSSTYYVEPLLKYSVKSKGPQVELKAYLLADDSFWNTTAYDDVFEVLTTGANNSDYNMTLGASEAKTWYLKIQNARANSQSRVGAVCTYRTNSTVIDKVEVKETGWARIYVPKHIANAAPSFTMSTGPAATGDYYDCYAPSAPITLNEYDTVTIKLVTTAASTDPVTLSSGGFGAVVLDQGYAKGKDGKVYYDYYSHDDNEYVGGVGATEDLLTPRGRNVGVLVQAN